MKTAFMIVSVASMMALGSAAMANTVEVSAFSLNGWYNGYGDSGGGSSTLTNYASIDGDGALRIQGDRTRAGFGNVFPSSTANALGLLSDVSAYSFQFAVSSVGGGVKTAQAPALRLVIWDPSQGNSGRRVSLVWEDGEQSTRQFVSEMGPVGNFNTPYTGDFFGANSRVYAFTSPSNLGRGVFDVNGTKIPGSDSAQSYSSILSYFGPDAVVTGLELGVGSSAGGFDGYADRVTIAFGGEGTTYNFVPTPGTAAALGLAGLVGLRRRR